MGTLLIAVAAALGFIVAYHTYGRWLGSKIFRLSADAICPSQRLRDGHDYVPTATPVVFGHHFTSIAGTGPIVGPAIAVMWGWLPALLWVVLGSIFIGAVHDLGSLVVSLRNNGQTVGDIAGRVMNRRVRLLFLFVLFMALTIVLAIFGLVIATVFRQFPAAIFPCMVQIPLAIGIGTWLHRRGVNLLLPSIIALGVMYLTVVIGDENFTITGDTGWKPVLLWIMHHLHGVNEWMASWSNITWVAVLLVYSYVASVLPVWLLLQPRDYINALQLLTALGLIVIGLLVAAMVGGAPPVEGAERVPLTIAAPMWNPDPPGAPMIFPFLFITIACGAISGFHCLVSSGTSSKQLKTEPDARFVAYGGMLTEGFLATLVILACVAGLGLGFTLVDGNALHRTGFTRFVANDGTAWRTNMDAMGRISAAPQSAASNHVANHRIDLLPGSFERSMTPAPGTPDAHSTVRYFFEGELVSSDDRAALIGRLAWKNRYQSWSASGGLAATVGAFVDGSANFLRAIGIPGGVAVALMGVLVASFAGTTLDTACRLQRYVIQELAATFLPRGSESCCPICGYSLAGHSTRTPEIIYCPECGETVTPEQIEAAGHRLPPGRFFTFNPLQLLTNKHGATLLAVGAAIFIAAMPARPPDTSLWQALTTGGLTDAAEWITTNAGTGGMILWPLFGATNQLLAGLAFIVIAFYLWRRGRALWFLILPMIFMLIMPMWAMVVQVFIGTDAAPAWLNLEGGSNWTLATIGLATIALELWMIVEAALMFPKARGVLESGALDASQAGADALRSPALTGAAS